MRRPVLSLIAVALGAMYASLWADPALADKRVALVIGNSGYQNAAALPNPMRDAQAMAARFKEGGFVVVTALDSGIVQFKRVIREFEDATTDADIVVIYYAGHGIEVDGINYLVPVDAKLAKDRDAQDEAVTLERLVESADAAKRLRLIILDACRDNPFAKTMKRQRTAAVRGAGWVNPGLGRVEPTSGSSTLIAYAAKQGFAAEDGDADHSPFTAALLNNLFEPGLDIRLALGRVRDDVMKTTNNRQEPWASGSLGGGNIALVSAPAEPPVAARSEAEKSTRSEGEKSDYNLVEAIGTDPHAPPEVRRRAYEIFINQYPSGFYSDLARQHLLALAALQPSKPQEPPGPSSEEQRAWDKIKDSSDAGKLHDFIKRYPSSVLANVAQSRLDAIERSAREAREREEKARAEREELARQKAERDAEAKRQAAEREAALKRAAAEAKAAEEARLKAEREAALKREEEERQRRLAEAARAKQEAEAKAAQERAEREAALAREEAERQRKLAEAARAKQEADAKAAQAKAEREAALERAAAEAKAAEEARAKAEREAALKREEEERQRKLAETARASQEACKREEDRLTALQAKGIKARDDLKQLEQGLTCERLRPLVLAALARATAWPDVNSSEQVRAAQLELARLGCYADVIDGSLGAPTKAALAQYQARRGRPGGDIDITDAFVAELKSQTAGLCTVACPAGKIAEGDQCVPERKPLPVARPQHEEEEPASRRHAKQHEGKPEPRQKARAEREPERPRKAATRNEPRVQPRVRQEASRGPSGSGSHGTTIGVGF